VSVVNMGVLDKTVCEYDVYSKVDERRQTLWYV
jgi:hypothetical protein